MEDVLYEMIFKRKSFHLFKDIGNEKITDKEISDIYTLYSKLKPLFTNIKTEIKIVPSGETNCKRGSEYCILLYSEKKDNYLQNIGYLGEQLDLYLVSKNIGTLWFGIGKVSETKYNNLDFVIMIAISKIDDKEKFRKDMYKSKRKELSEIWQGNDYKEIGSIVRFAPSSCNTQPWIVETSKDELKVYRYKKPGKWGMMPHDEVIYYNRIDTGIFLLFLDLCLKHQGIKYNRELYMDDKDTEKTLLADYSLQKTLKI